MCSHVFNSNCSFVAVDSLLRLLGVPKSKIYIGSGALVIVTDHNLVSQVVLQLKHGLMSVQNGDVTPHWKPGT